jgi:hypothetical protein
VSVAQVNAATFDAEVRHAKGPVVVKFFGKT